MRSVAAACGFMALIGATVLVSGPALSAPQQLLNKTLTLSWTAQTLQRDPSGKERGVASNIRYVVYVSSLGRLFERSSRSANGRTQGGDQELNASQTKMGEARGLRFEGNTLVVNRGYGGAGGSGAMRAIATFDASYSNCTLVVSHGKENGGTIKRQGMDGVVREYVSITVTGASCSVQSGNALAN